MNKSQTKCEQVVNKSWTSNEQVLNNSWTSCPWTIYEQLQVPTVVKIMLETGKSTIPGCMYGVCWFPTAVRIRISQPPAGLGLGLSLAIFKWTYDRTIMRNISGLKESILCHKIIFTKAARSKGVTIMSSVCDCLYCHFVSEDIVQLS